MIEVTDNFLPLIYINTKAELLSCHGSSGQKTAQNSAWPSQLDSMLKVATGIQSILSFYNNFETFVYYFFKILSQGSELYFFLHFLALRCHVEEFS
jgi:hypothetical protein